jgi:hypothetical protein
VLVTGPFEVHGTETKASEVLAVAQALSVCIEKLMPQIEALPDHGVLRFTEALTRSLMEWAEKR